MTRPAAIILALAALFFAAPHASAAPHAPAPQPAAPAPAQTPAIEPPARDPSPDPMLDEPLQQDPRLLSGTLPNGLRYHILQHANPPERISMWMHIRVGSLQESDDERGIAHYLEHLAFCGSDNFPPGTVVSTFESLGLTFGRHQNASTGFEQTNYQIALPDNSPEKFEKALLFFADVNGRLAIHPDEIERERRVIHQEKASRSSPQQRVLEEVYRRMTPGTIFGERLPIGTEETINSLAEADFRRFYQNWYTPANTVLTVVADLDPQVALAAIEKHFAPLPARDGAPRREIPITPYPKSFAAIVTDPEISRATVAMTRIDTRRPPLRTLGDLRREMLGQLACTAFRTRMADKVRAQEVRFLSANAFSNNTAGTFWQVQAAAGGDPADWPIILADLGTELQRARLHGFSDEEIDRARRDTLASLAQRASTEDTLPARSVLQRMNNFIVADEPIMSAAQRLELGERLLHGISTRECGEWFAAEFDPSAVMVLLQLPANADIPTDERLLSLWNEAVGVSPDAQAAAETVASLMEQLPAPAPVIEESFHEASGVWSGWFENGVRLHHRQMDTRRNIANITITLMGGELLETEPTRLSTQAAIQAWNQPATRAISSTQIRTLMTGKRAGLSGRGGRDSVQLSIGGSPDDFDKVMQLAHLLLTQPVIEDSAFTRWQITQIRNLENLQRNPAQMSLKLIADLVFPEDPRLRVPPISRAQSITRQEAQSWLDTMIATAPIEVAVVGDISRERAIDLVARYVATLPKRPRTSPSLHADLRRLPPPPPEARTIDRTMETPTPMGTVYVAFYGPDKAQRRDTRAMQAAAQILSSRMAERIRAQEQLAYSIRTFVDVGQTFPGYGLVRASSPTIPADADTLARRIVEIFDEFAADGPTPEEVAVAQRQAQTSDRDMMRDPGFWSDTLELLTFDGSSLDDVLADPDLTQSITAADIRDTFARYYRVRPPMRMILRTTPPRE
jgi:zinc protease